MGQREVIDFLSKEYRKNSERKFSKEEIKQGIGKAIGDSPLNHSLRVLSYYREIEREIKGDTKFNKTYRYRYIPNGPFKIVVLKK
jgi:hypothetical protein